MYLVFFMSFDYENHQGVHQDALFAIILTVAIVIILGFGMGLMATDLQALLLDPIERLTGMAKVFGGKKKDGDDKGDDKLASAADKLLELFPKENPLKNFTELIGDLERAFGLRLSRARNVLITLEANLIPRIEALDATLRQCKDGSLRLEDLVAKGKVLFSEEGLRAVLRIDTLPPEAQRAGRGLAGGRAVRHGRGLDHLHGRARDAHALLGSRDEPIGGGEREGEGDGADHGACRVSEGVL